MTAVYVDTNVFLYAIGTSPRYREPCRAIVTEMGEGRLRGEVSTLVLQELTGFLRRRSIPQVAARTRDVARLVAAVHPVRRDDLDRALTLLERHESLSLADAIHAAAAQERGIGTIISADPDFDDIAGLRRVDPLDTAGIWILRA